jgi:hypothetical protein
MDMTKKSETKTYKIRYNTQAISDENCWRVIPDGQEEILVNGIHIEGGITTTTKDFMEDMNAFKYHITCTGVLEVKDNIAYITNG